MKKWLVVEDDVMLRKAYAKVAAKQRVELVSTALCAEALRLALVERPSVIVLDLRLEDGDSLNLLRALRATPATARVPVVVVSGHLSPDVVRECREAGATGTLAKPWSVDALVEALAAAEVRRKTPPPPPPEARSR